MPTPPIQTGFPATRLRRLRATDWSRRLVREAALSANDLIWAIVLRDGERVRGPVDSMPGVERLSVDYAVEAAQEAEALGIPALALFPYTDTAGRTSEGGAALDPNNLMCRAARAIKATGANVGLIGDVALDPYTDHGHDGLLIDGEIANDETLEVLKQQAVVLAEAGFDVVAPSDMMDGRIGVIRAALEERGFKNTQIMSYAVKYASAFYGPYRDAIGSGGVLQGDKKTYQMDPGNAEEGLREVALDLAEGADSVMVKPGLPYLDMVTRVKSAFGAPTFAFQVSGEYAMIMAASQNGWIEADAAILESLLAFKRAGADGVITYFAPRAAKLLSR